MKKKLTKEELILKSFELILFYINQIKTRPGMTRIHSG